MDMVVAVSDRTGCCICAVQFSLYICYVSDSYSISKSSPMLKTNPILLIAIVFFTSCNTPMKKEKDLRIQANGDTVMVNHFDNGALSDETTVKKGVPNGPYTSYYQNGSIKETGLLINGLKGSIWKSFDSSSHLLWVRHYDDDKVIY